MHADLIYCVVTINNKVGLYTVCRDSLDRVTLPTILMKRRIIIETCTVLLSIYSFYSIYLLNIRLKQMALDILRQSVAQLREAVEAAASGR